MALVPLISWCLVLVPMADAAPAETLKPAEPPVLVESAEAPLPPRPDAEQVIAGFLTHLKASEEFDASARGFVVERAASLSNDTQRDFLNSSLAVLSDGFRIGLDLLDNDNPTKAGRIFEALAADEDPYLAVAAATQAASAMVDLEEIERCHDILSGVKERLGDIEPYTLEPDHFTFMLGYCQVHMLKYDEAGTTLTTFLQRYPDAPERLRITAGQIVTELERRAPGQLGDVRDLMNYARRRLDRGPVDAVVVARQNEAVELLSAMIQEAEDREKSKQKSSCKKCDGKSKCKSCDGKDGSGQTPGGGAQQSTLPGGEQRTGEMRRVIAKPGEEWGRMPPRQREEILQTLQRRFPSQYRELLEQYYRQLAKDAQPQ